MKHKELYESKTPKVYKSTKLNASNFGNFTNKDYQVYLILLSKIGTVDKHGKYTQPKELKREHTLSAKEFSRVFNIAQPHSYDAIKKAVNKLMKTDITVPKENSDSYLRINVCSQAEYINNEGKINVKFTDDIMPYLKQVKERFMVYNLAEISNFKSIYTTRLFELLQEFKETGWVVKSTQQLRHSFALENKYSRYGHLKARTLVPACEEINKHYNMKLRFEEIKEGKEVVAIKFIFKPVLVIENTDKKTGKTKKRFIKRQKNIVDNTQKTKKVLKTKNSKEHPNSTSAIMNRKNGGMFSSILNFFRK